LENNDLEQAIDFATVFSHLDFFTHILELLLHDTLEIEADNAPPEEGFSHFSSRML
jgi:RIC1